MRRPKVTLPEEDPATKAAREREQRRAENTRTEETQALLLGDTVRRLRRFGRVSGGSVPIYGRPAGSGGISGGSGVSAGSGGGGVDFGGGLFGNGGGDRAQTVLY